MDNNQLDKIFKDLLGDVSGGLGEWQMLVQGMRLTCYTDELHNRMRLIAPIIPAKELTVGQLKKCMQANFHTLLDAKYALSDGQLWVVFIHPLRELTDHQVKDAVNQMYSALTSFGTTYNGGDLKFPTQDDFRRNHN